MIADAVRELVVVGASAAGLAAAEGARAAGYVGHLTLIGDEPRPPYDRPPLSKQILAGIWAAGRVELRPRERYTELGIDLRLGASATGVDLDAREVHLADGAVMPFDRLIVATGARARRGPGAPDLTGIHTLRTLDDALRLRAAINANVRLVVVGAGVLGTEIAATARQAGAAVTLIGRGDAPMEQQLGAELARALGLLHLERGVELRMRSQVTDVIAVAGRAAGVLLSDGTRVPADLVFVAVGAAPSVEWLRTSGLDVSDGVVCDSTCRAAPGVYAAGDVASWYNRRFRRRMRVEHRLNATEQGAAAARNALGEGAAFTPVPYFWSDQFGTRFQAYGVMDDAAAVTVAEGGLAERRCVVTFVRDGVLVGVVGWNSPKPLLAYRQRIVSETG